jgi:hypothetical protein
MQARQMSPFVSSNSLRTHFLYADSSAVQSLVGENEALGGSEIDGIADPEGSAVFVGMSEKEGTALIDGDNDGKELGGIEIDGIPDGNPEGFLDSDGNPEGDPDGIPDGIPDGMPDGLIEGMPDGTSETDGELLGIPDGELVGPEGIALGVCDGPQPYSPGGEAEKTHTTDLI